MNYKGLLYIAFAAAAFAFGLLNRVHMFQLNAYKYTFHKDWIKSNFASLCAKAALFFKIWSNSGDQLLIFAI